ncbi:MAG: YfhO family protein [Actinomycetota bacterium]
MTDRPAHAAPYRPLALALLALVWLAFSFPVLGGRVLFPVDHDRALKPRNLLEPPRNPLESDAYTLYYPLRQYLGDRLREADIPLWEPHRFAGAPFAANAQTAVWYPPSWLFATGDTLTTYSLLLVVSRMAGLLLAYWFFRILNLQPLASALGAIVFVFSGFLIGWAVHITFVSSAIWLPLALGGVTLAQRGERRRGILLGAVGLALSVLGGHPQVALYVWLITGLWAAVGAASDGLTERRRGARAVLAAFGRTGWPVLASMALATGLAALQVLSSLDFAGSTIRGVEPFEEVAGSGLPLRQLLALLVPDLFGNPLDGNVTIRPNYTEAALYGGIFTLVLATVAVVHRRDRITAGFAAIGAVGLLAALGTLVFRFLYLAVPGLSRLRGAHRFIMLLDVALAGLAAVGLDTLLRQRRPRTAVVASGVVALVLLASVAFRGDGVTSSYLLPRIVLALAVLVGCVAFSFPRRTVAVGLGITLLVGVDLWAFGFRYHPFQEPRPLYQEDAGIRYLLSQDPSRPRFARLDHYWVPLNGSLVHGSFEVQGYDNFVLRRYVDLVSLAEDQHENARAFNVIYNFRDRSLLSAPVMRLLGVRFLLVPPGEGTGSPVSTAAYDIEEEDDAHPAAFVTPCWRVVRPGTAIEELGSMSADEMRSIAVIERRSDLPGPFARSSSSGSCRPGPAADVRTYEPERVQLAATLDAPGVLVLSDVWDAGWKAEVDGREAPVLQVDHALRGVPLEPGSHSVTLRYQPAWLLKGLALTGLSVLILVTVALFGRRRRPVRTREPDGPPGRT